MFTRKVIASASLLLLLSGTSAAMDYRHDAGSFINNVGWDQKSLQTQTEGAVYMRAEIKRLRKENENLRNSIAQIRKDADAAEVAKNDPRIRALVEENQRLASLLQTKNDRKPINDPRIQALVEENQKLARMLENQRKIAPSTAVYSERITELEAENEMLQASLSQLASQNSTARQEYSSDFQSLKQEVITLKAENRALIDQLSDDKSAHNQNISGFQAQSNKILTLQSNIEVLREENRNLAQALAESSAKIVEYKTNVEETSKGSNLGPKETAVLRKKLIGIEAENKTLRQKISEISESLMAQASTPMQSNKYEEQIQGLQAQNDSLRETIKAQTTTLLSTDNAGQTAERLISENSVLMKKLEIVMADNAAREKAAKELMQRNEQLHQEIAKRDNYIQRTQNSNMENTVPGSVVMLQEQNKALEDTLRRERESIMAYRMKIKEYQDEIKARKLQDSSEVADLESPDAQVITNLKIENQELKARIKLMSANNNMDSASLLKEAPRKLDMKTINNQLGAEEQLNDTAPASGGAADYIETEYPPVDQVLPLLDENGRHQFRKQHQ